MAKKAHVTPMLDELENGPWPSFISGIKRLRDENVRVRFIGSRADLDSEISALIEQAEQMTEGNTGLNLTVAFNYGAREELMQAAKSLAADAAKAEKAEKKAKA